MALDANLFATMGTKPKSMGDYQQEMDAHRANTLVNQLNAFKLQDAAQAQQDDATYRNLAKTFGNDAQANAGALRQQGLYRQAQALEKTALDTEKERAGIGKTKAETQGLDLKNFHEKIGTGMNILQSSTNPQQVMLGVYKAMQSGVMSQEDAKAAIGDMPQDPQGFTQWRESQLMQGMDVAKRLELVQKAATERRTAANEIMVADPNNPGKFIVNQPYVAAKEGIAKKGATNVDVKVDTKYGEGVAKEVGPMLKSSYDAAIGAQASIATADSLISAIDSGKVISGPGASLRLKGAQFAESLGIGGADTAEKIANTRAAIQGLAQTTLTARKQLAGQGQVSDNEGKLLERAASGNIDDMTAAEIKQIAQVNKRLAQRQVQMHREFVTKVRGKKETADIADMFDLPTAGDSTPPPTGGLSADEAKELEQLRARFRGK